MPGGRLFCPFSSRDGELTQSVEDALFNTGRDDATLSIQYGLLFVEFSRASPSLEEAIISAINAVRNAGIGVEVLRVDECNLVTMSEIARESVAVVSLCIST